VEELDAVRIRYAVSESCRRLASFKHVAGGQRGTRQETVKAAGGCGEICWVRGVWL